VARICMESKVSNFHGFIRFDTVPKFILEQDIDGLGAPQLQGLYEINTNSPECIAAGVQLHRAYPELSSINAPGLIARQVNTTFGKTEKIIMVVGTQSCDLKRAWADQYLLMLKSSGLNIEMRTSHNVMLDPPDLLYVFGDVRRSGGSQFDTPFVDWLYNDFTGETINTCSNDYDLGDKGLLLDSLKETDLNYLVGEQSRHLKGNDDIEWSLEMDGRQPRYKELVFKPNNGKSGEKVIHGIKCIKATMDS